MKHFKATIKEKGMDGVIRTLRPEFVGDATKEYLINFWGLNNPDVLEWTIEEVFDNGYYTIVCADRDDFIQLDDKWELVEQKPAWSEEDETVLDNLIYALANDRIGNDRDEYVDWLKSIKDRVQPKQEWSDYDECMLTNLIDDPHCSIDSEYVHWLKSLKERYTWKPSDLPHWQKSNLPNHTTTGFNSDYFCHKGYFINYKELFKKLPKDD